MAADILKLAHHGISRPHRELMEAVQPEICVLTNAFNDQSQDCVDFLTRSGYPVLSTRREELTFLTDGTSWVYETRK